jgi:hypothetical protein
LEDLQHENVGLNCDKLQIGQGICVPLISWTVEGGWKGSETVL